MVSSSFSRYKAVKNSSTESFLQTKAIEMEKRNIPRTYVALTPELDVLGYITLSIKCMSIPKENLLGSKTLGRMNIEEKTGVAQSYLLGQLSRSDKSEKGFGTILMELAMKQVKIANKAVGCRMFRLDCHDDLVPYYEQFGFRLVRKNDDGTLNQMITFIDKDDHQY